MYKVLGLGLQKKEVEGEERGSDLGRGRRKKRQELWRRWATKLGYGGPEPQQPANTPKPLEGDTGGNPNAGSPCPSGGSCGDRVPRHLTGSYVSQLDPMSKIFYSLPKQRHPLRAICSNTRTL